MTADSLTRPEAGRLRTTAIRTDGGTQSRVAISMNVVAEYMEAMRGGSVFPPVVVFFDGEQHWLADGFHRLAAAKRLARHEIDADVREGTVRDARLFSIGANASHGLRRTNACKRNCVNMLLDDAEWSQRSSRWIAKAAGVSHPTVLKWRERRGGMSTRLVGVDGRKNPSVKPARETVSVTAAPSPRDANPTTVARKLIARHGADWCRDLVIALDAECARGDS